MQHNDLTRRAFLKNSSSHLAALALAPALASCQKQNTKIPSSAAPTARSQNVNDYYQRFAVDDTIIQQTLADALASGADYAEIFFQHRIAHAIALQDGDVNRAANTVDYGAGVRVVKGDQIGYSFTETITQKALRQAARTAATIAQGTAPSQPVGLNLKTTPDFYPIDLSWQDAQIDKKIAWLQRANQHAFALDNRIVKVNISFADETNYILICRSDGLCAADCQPMMRAAASCTAQQNDQRETNFGWLSARQGAESLHLDDADTLAHETVQRTLQLFQAVKPQGGEMPMVLGAGRSGILLHEAIGHGLEADANRKGISIFSDNIGHKVANEFVTIVDDATVPHQRGSINIDDEGNTGQNTVLVQNGILKNYMHDTISAKHYRVSTTGNGRRQSFRFAPIPRMRNTYMLPGPHKKEEILQSVKKGLYAEVFTNGQVMIGAGDFTFYVKSGYLIENGKLTRPVKDVNVIGNGPDVLSKITMVADQLELSNSGGTCGKAGQWVPVSFGLPLVKVSAITVGGA